MKRLFWVFSLLGMMMIGCSEGFDENKNSDSEIEWGDDTDIKSGLPAPGPRQIYYKTIDNEMIDFSEQSWYQKVVSNDVKNDTIFVLTFNQNFADMESCADITFERVSRLKSIRFPEGFKELAGEVCYCCSDLESVVIPQSVTTVGLGAFAFCLNLKEFGGKFASADARCLIEDGQLKAFAPKGVTEQSIPTDIVTIDDFVYSQCPDLKAITITGNVKSIGSHAFAYCSNLERVTMLEGVELIGYWAFVNCAKLTDVAIPESVTTIVYEMFKGCEKLKNVVLPKSITSIESYAFWGCEGMETINIPKGVTSIGENAFRYCLSLNEVTIPSSVKTIYDFVFAECENLEKVVFEEGVTSIPYAMFYRCAKLTDITVPETVKTIEAQAFQQAYALESVTIPASVELLGESVFNYCSNLNSVYCKSVTPPAIEGSYPLFGVDGYDVSTPKDVVIYVPTESVEQYKSAEGWSEYADNIVGYDFE